MLVQIIVYGVILVSFGFNLYINILNYKHKDAKIPEEVKDIYDEEKYEKWKNYTMENFRFSLVVNTVSTLVLLALFIAGLFPLFLRLVESITANQSLQVVLFLGIYYLINYIIGLFSSYHSIFVIEEKYGFNKTTKSTFVKDKIKGFLLTTIFVGSIIFGLSKWYFTAGDMFFIYAFVACFVGMLIVQILYVRLFVPMFNKLTPLEDGSLKTKIEDFAKSVGYEVGKISVMDASRRSTKLNAYFTGFGRLKKIVLYDTLIEKCTEEEVVAVLAHEIGHNKHKHIISGIFQSAIMLALFLGLFILLSSFSVFSSSFGFNEPFIGFIVILFIVLFQPVMIPIGLLTQWISRKHEYQADAYAAKNYSEEHIINSLKVLARENFSNLNPHPLYVKINYTHPPTYQRIRAINTLK